MYQVSNNKIRNMFKSDVLGHKISNKLLIKNKLSTKAFLNVFGQKPKINQLKKEIIEYVSPLKRGLIATDEDKEEIEKLVKSIERMNKDRNTLKNENINGKWELIYTTSESILQLNKPAILRTQGPIYQYIDVEKLKAKNARTWPLFDQVEADLSPLTKSKVKVQFSVFKILGLIPVKAPPTARGTLDTTFVDEEMRISRGDKGNLFILTMQDANARL